MGLSIEWFFLGSLRTSYVGLAGGSSVCSQILIRLGAPKVFQCRAAHVPLNCWHLCSNYLMLEPQIVCIPTGKLLSHLPITGGSTRFRALQQEAQLYGMTRWPMLSWAECHERAWGTHAHSGSSVCNLWIKCNQAMLPMSPLHAPSLDMLKTVLPFAFVFPLFAW